MEKIEELEKYKKLLDDGAISEEEFRLLKQKLLGLKTDEEKEMEKQQERDAALAEIEKMREEKNKELQEQREKEEAERLARQEEENRKKYQQAYEEEKAKEQARLEAEHEAEKKLKQEKAQKMQETAKGVSSVVKTIILWLITAFLVLLCIGSFGTIKENGLGFIAIGIITLLLAIFACPYISSVIKKNPQVQKYYKFKKYIVILLVIVLFIVMLLI